jgi:predicted rRNA methylase YqxC with S4 and FtsJ domains
MQLQEDSANDLEALKREVEEEIADIKAAKLSSGELVTALATTRVSLRYTEQTLKFAKELATPMNEAIAIAQKAIQSRDEAERDMAIANERQSKLIQLLPKAFQAGKRTLAKAGVTARHQENRAIKQDVFAWLDTNMQNFKSMDSAAEAIAGKVAPVKFRTARDWVGEWKKLRSTGTP